MELMSLVFLRKVIRWLIILQKANNKKYVAKDKVCFLKPIYVPWFSGKAEGFLLRLIRSSCHIAADHERFLAQMEYLVIFLVHQ